jgi:hypothetical protein
MDRAVRLYASDTDWIQKVDELARRSSCIVVETARSDNLRVEYEYLRREGLHEKLFVFTGHPSREERRFILIWQRMRFGTLHVGWQKFSADLALLGYDLGFSDPGPGSVITFDADGRGILLTTQAVSAAEFVDPIGAWMARREKIGRCVPTSCLSCSRKFHVFPADSAVVRERWCRNCELFGGRRVSGHLLLTGYQNLANAGDAVAMANLGIVYRQVSERRAPTTKFDVEVREYRNAMAASWFRKAAEAGDVGGMINLADMHEKGIGGLQKDANQALHWYERAAKCGSRVAQLNLERLQTPN